MEPIAQIAQLPNGQVAMKFPANRSGDLIWMLGWLETVKQGIHAQIKMASERTVAVPHPAQVNGILKP